MTHIPGFVNEYGTIDGVFFEQVKKVIEMAMAPGALDAKTKVLIVLALDTLKGAAEGVKVLAAQARELGATDQELAEAIRLAYFVAGMDPLKTGLNAFQHRPHVND
ncbi:MAG: carboxymuconolactone decarboxylase family protein [Syntrophomonadaceae bacterium]|jgi:alkylhydroperoxidase/carboxymuconolactone decarboxylase family protein YurZ|nr:carboxymuconolactone decarboxylase family protein [Syntrophomonadaceae bacterium]